MDGFDLSDDGKLIAYVVNEAGTDRLRLMDVASGRVRKADALPAGLVSGLEFSPWGELGFSLSSAKSASDCVVARPQDDETHPLDAERNRRAGSRR